MIKRVGLLFVVLSQILVPASFAQRVAESDAQKLQRLRAQAEYERIESEVSEGIRGAIRSGWSFLNPKGKELKVEGVLEEVKKHGKLRVLTPEFTDFAHQIGIEVELKKPKSDQKADESFKPGYRIKLKDSEFKKSLTDARLVEVHAEVGKEEKDILAVQRTVSSLVYEAKKNEPMLAKAIPSILPGALTGMLLSPKAHAGVEALGRGLLRFCGLMIFICILFSLLTVILGLVALESKMGRRIILGFFITWFVSFIAGLLMVDDEAIEEEGLGKLMFGGMLDKWAEE